MAWGLVVLLALPSFAWAGGKQRSVPDLRRDAAAWSEAGHRRRGPIELSLTIHIASDEGDPIASQARIRRWVRRANRELAAAGVQVVIRDVRVLPSGLGSVTRWKHRRALAHFAPHDGTIHVFVIQELDTERRRSFHRRIRGLHWRYWGLNPKLRAREYIVVTRDAPTTTFAHELGHLFGLRHSSRDDNIMCSCRRGPAMSFSDAQAQEMREGVRRLSAKQPPEVRAAADRR